MGALSDGCHLFVVLLAEANLLRGHVGDALADDFVGLLGRPVGRADKPVRRENER